MNDWVAVAITESARVVRHALGSWGRTTRLCVLALALAFVGVVVATHQ